MNLSVLRNNPSQMLQNQKMHICHEMKAFSGIFNTFWGEFPHACRTKDGKDTHWTPTRSWTKCHPHWGGKSQGGTPCSPGQTSQDRTTANIHPGPPKLLGGGSGQPGRRNVAGMHCRRWWKPRQVPQNNLPFTKNQTWTLQGKQSNQVSTDTHTHPLPDTQSIQKIDFFHCF